jgi:hypothetical protein
MRRCAIITGVLLVLCASPAFAGSGNGLYQPFPAAVSYGPAISYYARLHLSLGAAQLRAGRFSGALRLMHSNGPSDRAAASSVGLGTSGLVVIAALALIVAALAAARARVRPRARVS